MRTMIVLWEWIPIMHQVRPEQDQKMEVVAELKLPATSGGKAKRRKGQTVRGNIT